MRALLVLFRHIGGIPFALTLIAATAALTAWGTLVEAQSASHLLAMQKVYQSTLFTVILWGFFLNILVSALRRWPFQKKHVPFLTTHCGLLMILGGVMIKNSYGLQGIMTIIAGSANSDVVLPNTFVLQVEDSFTTAQYPVHLDSPGVLKKEKKTDPFPLLEISMLSSAEHSSEELESWFQTDRQGKTYCRIQGLLPIPIRYQASDASTPLSMPALQIPLTRESAEIWKIYALETDEIAALAKKLYIDSAVVVVSRRSDRKELIRQPLKTFLSNSVTIDGLLISAFFKEPLSYNLHWEIFLPDALIHTEMTLPLEGTKALLNDWKEFIPHPALNIAIDIEQQPTLAWIRKEGSEQASFFGYNATGEILSLPLSNKLPAAILAYDGGRQGYGVTIPHPLPEKISREEREVTAFSSIEIALRHGIAKNIALAPPLMLLKQCCEANKLDFIAIFLEFLRAWKNEGLLLSHSQLPLAINWHNLPEIRALQWSVTLMDQIQEQLSHNTPASEIPLLYSWPMILSEQASFIEKLTIICRQLIEAQELLPDIALTAESGQLFSTYCRAWGLSPQDLLISQEREGDAFRKEEIEKKNPPSLYLEAPLTYRRLPAPSQKKAEDNRPLIFLEVKEGRQKEKISLSYESAAVGLKWPIFGGRYLLRFQPAVVTLPWRLRLRDAQQILYAGASQPFSYQSTLLFTPTDQPESNISTVLSMNNIYETPDGFRFYLSSMSPADQTAVQRIQLAVNYDPAKSLLTYPGAIVLSLGIALFLMRPRNSHPK